MWYDLKIYLSTCCLAGGLMALLVACVSAASLLDPLLPLVLCFRLLPPSFHWICLYFSWNTFHLHPKTHTHAWSVKMFKKKWDKYISKHQIVIVQIVQIPHIFHQRNPQSFPTFNPQGVHRAIEHDPVMVLGSTNAVVRPSQAHLRRAFVTNEITWARRPSTQIFAQKQKSQSTAATHSPQTTNIPNWIIDPKDQRYKSSPSVATKSQGCDCPVSHCESAQPPPRRTTRASPFEEFERPRKEERILKPNWLEGSRKYEQSKNDQHIITETCWITFVVGLRTYTVCVSICPK